MDVISLTSSTVRSRHSLVAKQAYSEWHQYLKFICKSIKEGLNSKNFFILDTGIFLGQIFVTKDRIYLVDGPHDLAIAKLLIAPEPLCIE